MRRCKIVHNCMGQTYSWIEKIWNIAEQRVTEVFDEIWNIAGNSWLIGHMRRKMSSSCARRCVGYRRYKERYSSCNPSLFQCETWFYDLLCCCILISCIAVTLFCCSRFASFLRSRSKAYAGFHVEFGVYPLSLEVEIGSHASDGLFLAMEYKGNYKRVISHFLEISGKGILLYSNVIDSTLRQLQFEVVVAEQD